MADDITQSDGIAKTEAIWSDDYRGTRAQLIAAGLLRDGEFPGDGSNAKTCVRIHNGTIMDPRKQCPRDLGLVEVHKRGEKFLVSVYVDRVVGQRRLEAWRQNKLPWRKEGADGRLKANRDWKRFMMRAVHIPSMQRAKGEFHVDPIDAPAAPRRHEVSRPTTDFYEAYRDDQLLRVVHCHLEKCGGGDKRIEVVCEIVAELYWRRIDSRARD